jgi:hypothetical protein
MVLPPSRETQHLEDGVVPMKPAGMVVDPGAGAEDQAPKTGKVGVEGRVTGSQEAGLDRRGRHIVRILIRCCVSRVA